MKVLVSFPNTGWLHKHVSRTRVRIGFDQRYKVTQIDPTHNPFENNLHHIIQDFIAGNYGYWLSIDSDNPPINNPLDLIELDRDIIGCPTPVWHYTGKPGERPIYWNAYDYVPDEDAYKEHPNKSGLQKVDAIGTGCFVIARRVFSDPVMLKAPFERKLHPDGRVDRGNDISFCERARAQGFEIYAHYDYPCMHFQELELTEVIQAIEGIVNG